MNGLLTPQQPGLLQRLKSIPANNSAMLMALGAGLMDHGRDPRNTMGDAMRLGLAGGQIDSQNRLLRDERQQTLAKSKATRDYAVNVLKMDPTEADQLANAGLLGERVSEVWKQQSAGSDATYGLTPFYAEGPDGETQAFQPSNRGGVRQIELPEGFKPAAGVDKIDNGTYWTLLDKKTGQVVGVIPKDVAGEAAEAERGKSEGVNAAALPATLHNTQRLIEGIDDLIEDPALPRLTGPIQSWLPNVTGDANRAQSRLDLVMGGTFLQAYNDLRGAGQITEQEGQAAKAAYNRLLHTDMNDADFQQALLDFRAELEALKAIAAQRAGEQVSSDLPAVGQPAPEDPLGIR